MSSDSKDAEAEMPPRGVFKFARFDVSSQVFHTTPLTFAFVNLKPLLPGHILVSPIRLQPSLVDLTSEEISDLFNTVTRIQHTLKRVYHADAFNIAVQDGLAAGQSVPHVHAHVIPRQQDDAGAGDKVHEWLEGEEGDVGKQQRESREGLGKGREGSEGRLKAEWAKDDEREARSMEVMEAEARWLREEMAKDDDSSGRGEKL